VANRVAKEARKSLGILRDLVRGDVVGRCIGFHLDQSNQSAVLECRDQWSHRRTDHVCHDANDSESKADGHAEASDAAKNSRLDGYRGHVCCGCRDDRDLGQLVKGGAHPASPGYVSPKKRSTVAFPLASIPSGTYPPG
jgi:hypothetical protein